MNALFETCLAVASRLLPRAAGLGPRIATDGSTDVRGFASSHPLPEVRRSVRWQPLTPLFITLLLSLPPLRAAHAQVREGDAEVRRQALLEQWDGATPFREGSSGVTFDKWLQVMGVGRAAMRAAVTVPQPQQWTSIGPRGLYGDNGFFGSLPQLDAGRVPALAFHPTDRFTLYAGTSAGGVWKSTNEGASWVPLTDTECSLTTGAIAVDPVNPEIVYVGTGEPSEATAGCGVLRSTNGGGSWTAYGANVFTTNAATSWAVYSLVVDRASAGSTTTTTVLAATLRGIMRSTNSGQSWSVVTQPLTFSDLKQHPTDPNIMYAARVGVAGSAVPAGLWRSNDRGATWEVVTTFAGDSVRRIEIAVSPARPGSVWMIAGRADRQLAGLWRWDDATNSRVSLDAIGPRAVEPSGRLNFGGQSEYNLMIAVDPSDADIMYIGGVRAYKSTDGGTSFRETGERIHVDWHAIAVDPNDPQRVIAGNDGGMFLSRDRGNTWSSLNAGLTTSLHYPGLSLHPTDPTGVITGLQDNGTIITRNGMLQWNGVYGGDGAFTAINPESPNTYYVSSQSGNLRRVNATNGSNTRVWVDTIVERRRGFIAPFVLDASRPTRLYFGGARLFRTENEGTSWTPISPDLTRGTGVINAIALAPTDSTVIFVGTSDGNVRYTRDFGNTWLAPQTTLPARTVTDFAVHPTDANKVVVTIGGSGGPHVYLSRDGGATWSDITASLPDVTTQAVAWGPAGSLYVGNMYGVYVSTNEGQTWTRQSGMPTVRITDLVYNGRTNRLVAATYGRGIWAYDFSTPGQVLRGDVNGDGQVNAADALLIQQALIGVQLPATVSLFPAADANCDGKMEVLDALLVLKFAVGENNGACVGTRR